MLTTILCFVQANDFYDLPLGDDQGAISRFFTSGATGAVYHHTCECNWHHKYHECAVPSVVSLPTQFFLLQSAITAGLALRRGRHRTGARDMVGDGGASVTLAAPKAKKTGPQQSSIAQMFKRAAAASSCQAEVPGASSDQAENAATTPAQPSAQDALQSSTGPQALPGSVVPGSLSGEPAQRQEAAAFSGAASQCVGAAKGSEQASQDGKQTSQPVQQASSSQHRQEDSASYPVHDHVNDPAHPLQGVSTEIDLPGHASMEQPPSACDAADASEHGAPVGATPAARHAEPGKQSSNEETQHTSQQTQHPVSIPGSTRPSERPDKGVPCQRLLGDESALGRSADTQPGCDLASVDIEEQKRIMHEIWMKSRGSASRTGEDDVRDATSAAADRSAKRGRGLSGAAAGSAVKEGAGKQMRISAMFKTPRRT